ncbi:probable RNA-directed DNA polymerase from transposon X-element [Trichonephila clavipes]|nr:probable RNA-directed DNA polymerase from transposon X-element [Trichonephila clavipes]
MSTLESLHFSTEHRHPTVIEILLLLRKLERKGFDVIFSWVPGHVGILGNEQADTAARSMSGHMQRPVCYRDLKTSTQNYIHHVWQETWDQQILNKLHNIHPSTSHWAALPMRRHDVRLTRLRIGHTRFTHRHLLLAWPKLALAPLKLTIIIIIRELRAALHRSGNTAAGPDGLHYIMLRHLSESSILSLLSLFNRIWETHVFPTQWCHAHVLPFPKPGKDPTSAINYRPIALTSCLSKLMERMVSARLMFHLESHNLLSPLQSGFRKSRSTTDNLLRLETSIREAFVKKQYNISVFFDIKKAYDMSWRYACFHFIQIFLSKNKVSHKGLFLSVLLFIIKINSITHHINQGIQCSLYVDDVQISYSSKFLNVAQRHIQTTINNFTKWAEQNGFDFSTEKTVSVVFTRKRGGFPNPELFIGRSIIQVVNEVKFLGLIFDQSLRFHRHLKDLKIRSANALNILKVLANTHWGADRTSLLRLYRALIRSKLDYGSVVYSSACKSLLKILDPVHHQALRLCLGAFRTSPVESLYAEAYEPPLDLRRKIALEHISLSCGKKFIIYTDSLSALQSIVSLHSSFHPILVDITCALANHLKKKDIRFCWIPGHAGLTGNELADTASRSATGSSESPTLPQTIKAGYLNCKIRPYIPNPLRCFKCQRFGHSQTACRGQLTCSRCASVGHASSDCTLEQKCVNCSQPHSADSKLCPKWKIEKEIQTIKTNRNISYIEARKFLTPQPSQTYAQVAKSITVNNSSQTDETITKNIIKSSTSTQAELVPSTSSVTVASPSQSSPPNSVIDTTPTTSNSLSISAASSSSQSVIPPPSDSYKVPDAKKLAKARSRKRKKELLKKMKEAIVDIKMNPHRPKNRHLMSLHRMRKK